MWKEMLKNTKWSIIFIALTALTWIIAMPFLPDVIPMQFEDDGTVIWSTNKYLAPLLPLAAAASVYLSLGYRYYGDARYKEYASAYGGFNTLINGGVLFTCCASFLVIGAAVGVITNTELITNLLVGLIIIYISNYLQKIPFITNKIRIPWHWLYSDLSIWKKTMKLSGRVNICCGLLYIAFLMMGFNSEMLLLIFIAIIVLFPYIHSWIIYDKSSRQKTI